MLIMRLQKRTNRQLLLVQIGQKQDIQQDKIEDILQNCRPQTKLCIAANITCEGELIQTRTVKDWKGHVHELSKIPCIFLLYK